MQTKKSQIRLPSDQGLLVCFLQQFILWISHDNQMEGSTLETQQCLFVYMNGSALYAHISCQNSSTVIFACIPKESISIMILINASTLYPPVTILSSALSSAYLLRLPLLQTICTLHPDQTAPQGAVCLWFIGFASLVKSSLRCT